MPEDEVSREASQKALVAIKKGTDSESLKPLTLIQLQEDDELKTVEDLRRSLSSYVKRSDLFLSLSSFTIHKEDESKYQWKAVIWPIKQPASDTTNTGGDALAEGESEDKDPITNAEHPYIAIISAEGENVKAPELPGEHTFTPLPKSDLPKLPDAPTLAMVDPGAEAASKAAVNAAMLSDKQLAHLFDINGVFCGSSFLDHPSLRICSRIFQTYHPLHELIQVSDESSIETHTTSSAHESNLAKYGCIEASVEVSTPWVGVSASYSHTHSTATFKTGSKTYTTAISRYPRAIIRLPVSSLKATDEFKEELKAALKGETDDIKRESLGNFFAKYGHAFPTEVHLGGHLHMTQTEESSGGSSTGAKETQIRAALTTAIHIGGSAAYSSKEDHDTKHAQSASSLGIEAVGGNTLLASNLALWPLSVMPYPNWRVTKLSKVKLITDIKTLFDDSQRAQVLKLFGPSARSTGHRGRDDDNDKPL